jgi:hypothetical protein
MYLVHDVPGAAQQSLWFTGDHVSRIDSAIVAMPAALASGARLEVIMLPDRRAPGDPPPAPPSGCLPREAQRCAQRMVARVNPVWGGTIA